MGYPLFIEPVKSDLPRKRKTVLSPAPANVRAARRSESGEEGLRSHRLTPAQWMQRYGPDHTTAARLRRTRDAPRALSPEIPVLNVLESFHRMHESLQFSFERRLRRILPRFDLLMTCAREMIDQSISAQARLRGRGENDLWPAERERLRAQTLSVFGGMHEVTRLTNSDVDALRAIRREIESVTSVNGPAALARVRLRAVRNRRWNASPTENPAERARSSESDSQYMARHLTELRERWRTDETNTQEGSQNVDGLGDRERSPEDSWNTLRYTMTPDPELPSNSSSFTSMPNIIQRSWEQPEESRGSHWLGLTESMDTEEADALLPPTANGEPDCDILDAILDESMHSRRGQQRPGRIGRDVLSALNHRLENRDGEDQQRRSMANMSNPSTRRHASRVVFGGLEDETRAIEAESRAPNAEDLEGNGQSPRRLSMEGFMSRIEQRLGHTPTQGEWEGQLSVGADEEEGEQPLPETQRPEEDEAIRPYAPFNYEEAMTRYFDSDPTSGVESGREALRMAVHLARSSGMSHEEMRAIEERVATRHQRSIQRRWNMEGTRETGEGGQEEGEAHRSRLLELMQSRRAPDGS